VSGRLNREDMSRVAGVDKDSTKTDEDREAAWAQLFLGWRFLSDPPTSLSGAVRNAFGTVQTELRLKRSFSRPRGSARPRHIPNRDVALGSTW
jgi:hypothetical protein